jgi:predicted transcriptional regulator
MAILTVQLDKEIAENLEWAAKQMGMTAADLTEKAIQQYLRLEAERKIAREMEVYESQHERLLPQYEGQYVAMHNGQIIDQDQDELPLYLRIREKHPLIGILIKQVTAESEHVLHVRSPRIEYR